MVNGDGVQPDPDRCLPADAVAALPGWAQPIFPVACADVLAQDDQCSLLRMKLPSMARGGTLLNMAPRNDGLIRFWLQPRLSCTTVRLAADPGRVSDAGLCDSQPGSGPGPLCDSEPGPGVLAFVDGQVAGWCSIAPKATYRALVNSRTIPHVDDADAWSAVCFVVRPGFRRRGLMHELLDGAVEHAHASGATVVEGYPVEPDGDRVDLGSAYTGTVQLFEAHGFRRIQQTTGRRGGKPRWLVRRELT